MGGNAEPSLAQLRIRLPDKTRKAKHRFVIYDTEMNTFMQRNENCNCSDQCFQRSTTPWRCDVLPKNPPNRGGLSCLGLFAWRRTSKDTFLERHYFILWTRPTHLDISNSSYNKYYNKWDMKLEFMLDLRYSRFCTIMDCVIRTTTDSSWSRQL